VAYLPWYGHLSESAREGVGHLPEPSIELVDLVWSALLGLQRASDFWLALAIPAVCFGVWGVSKRLRDPYVVCVAAIALVPIIQLVVSWLRTPVLDVRQSSPYIAGYAFLLALGLREAGQYVADIVGNGKLKAPVALAGACGVAILMLIACADWFNRGPREDWRQAASDSEGAGTVFIWRGYINEPMRYYTSQRLTPILPNAEVNAVSPGSSAVLVLSHNSQGEADSILGALGERWNIGEMASYPGIQLYPLQAR
jgi:hypothetical protein